MRQAVRAAVMAGVMAVPYGAHAQDAVIRIEAIRGSEAATDAAKNWAQQFDDVVTFPLSQGWYAIGLGPQSPEEAAARLAELLAADAVPSDSFVSEPAVALTAVGGAAAADHEPGDASQTTGTTFEGRTEDVPASARETVASEGVTVAGDMSIGEPARVSQAAPSTHIRLQTISGRQAAQQTLETWRERFAEADLWELPNGRYAVALGPLEPETAGAWMAAFRAAEAVPADAFLSETDELGVLVDGGATLDLPAPQPAEDLPPLADVQRALHWAGLYDGPVDGTDEASVQRAIARYVADTRVTSDPGAAMRALVADYAAWREELGLTELRDDHTGLAVNAPMAALVLERHQRQLSIYGSRNGSGAALILFSQPGGAEDLRDLAGLITAMGWVAEPERQFSAGHMLLRGHTDDFLARSEGWLRDGRAEGYVLIWPAEGAENFDRLAAEISSSLHRIAP